MNTDQHQDDPHAAALAAPLAALEDQLMAAFARAYPPRRWYQRWSPRQWGLAGGLGTVCAALALTVALTPQGLLPTDTGGGSPLIGRDNGVAFIALDSLDRIEQETAPRMVQANLARSDLVALGVPVTPENANEAVRAEMLVGANGEPLAVRLLGQP